MKKFILSCVIVCGLGEVFSQTSQEPNLSNVTKPVDILPPSPNSASLGQYGGINFGLSSGTASYTVPLYSLTSTNITVPLSLSYSSNGLKIDAIASRVGLGWNLEAGGVITRTVMGAPDEFYQRIIPPATYLQQNRDLINFMESLSQSSEAGPIDGQPDVFSFNFNGFNGRFVLDNNLSPVLLAPSAVKIEANFTAEAWNFKITAPDGAQYFFGGINATENTKKSSSGTNCGKGFPGFLPTAWYLISIIHPNNDQVDFTYSLFGFNYKAAVSESQFYKKTNTNTCKTADEGIGNCTVLSNTNCISWYATNTPLLQEINTNSGTKIKFSYINRSDVGDKLLAKLEVFQPSVAVAFKVFELKYQEVVSTVGFNNYNNSDYSLRIRPFFMSLTEMSPDGSLNKKHQFQYNDFLNLPARLSYAQDHYGYYNGATGNQSLLPTPSTEQWKGYFPSARANRETNGLFAEKGLLQRIIYPTGGFDDIKYEANTVYTSVPVLPPLLSINSSAYSGSNGPAGTASVTYSPIASGGITTQNHFRGSCNFNGTDAEIDPIHNKARMILFDPTTNEVYKDIIILPGEAFDEIVELTAGKKYQIKIIATGSEVAGTANMDYYEGQKTYQNINKEIGGVRVSRIVSANESDGKQSIKKYNYSALNTPSISSGGIIFQPIYEKEIRNKVMCDGPEATPPGEVQVAYCTFNTCDYASLHSNTLNNIYIYNGSSVNYQSVVVSFGENYENGGMEHQYTVQPDMTANAVIGDDIFGMPYTSFSYKNGHETFQHVFRKENSTIISVKKVFTSYKEDARISQTFKAYVANKKYNIFCQNNPPSDDEVNAYSLAEYHIFRKWYYPEETKTWTYDTYGQAYVEEKVTSVYDNIVHALPTQVKTIGSTNIQSTVRSFYPQDLSLSGDEEVARNGLIAKNVVSTVLKQTVQKENVLVLTTQTNYKTFPNGLILPYERLSSTHSNPLESRYRFFLYSDKGQLLEQQKTADVTNSYLWDYNASYPIAQVLNASNSQIAFTSFEADGTGNWMGKNEANIVTGASISGKKHYNLTGNTLSKSTLSSTTAYTVSYWSKNGACTVSGTQAGWPKSLNSILLNGQTWTLYIHQVYGQSTISVSGAAYIDDIRLHPLAAQMTTYTYDPLIGMTSQTDINNKTTYYEYDGLGRLSLVRDQDNNILKKYCYNYQGQQEDCGVITYTATRSGTFVKQCIDGGTGTSVIYTVTKTSTISQPDADQKAQAEVTNNGQSYANQNGSCTWTNDALSGSYLSQQCPSGQTPEPYAVSVAGGSYSSSISKSDANAQAQQWAQSQANLYGACSVSTPYARLSYENVWSDGYSTYGDVVIRFYSDAGGINPLNVSNLSVYYTENNTCNWPWNSSVTANSNAIYIVVGGMLSYQDWNGYEYVICNVDYWLDSNTGYTIIY